MTTTSNTAYQLTLASSSPSRLRTLRNAGIEPIVCPANLNEEAILDGLGDASAKEKVLALAQAKSRFIAQKIIAQNGANRDKHEQDGQSRQITTIGRNRLRSKPILVLGCDSMLELDGQVLGKPHTPAKAFKRIKAQAKRSAYLHTGHWLINLGYNSDIVNAGIDNTKSTTYSYSTNTASSKTGKSTFREIGQTASTKVNFGPIIDTEIERYVATGEPLEVAGAFTIDGYGAPFIDSIEGDFHNVVGLSLPLLRQLLAEWQISVTDLWNLPQKL